jgi:hypothetical protein
LNELNVPKKQSCEIQTMEQSLCQASQYIQTMEEPPTETLNEQSSIHEFLLLEETFEEPLEGQLKLSIHRGKAFTDHLFEVHLSMTYKRRIKLLL